MCGILDDILPVLGCIAGFALGGPAGAAIGGGLGGFAGNYAQTHNFGSAALGGLTGGVGGYFGGGSLANALSGLGNAAVGAGTEAFDTGLASNVASNTLGSLESGAGGAAMFGPAAGTGTAIGGAAGALGGGGLGIAGGDALSGVSGNPAFMGGLGGGTQGTGLGVGGQPASTADLSGVMNGSAASATPSAQATGITQSPVSSLNQAPSGVGITAPGGLTQPISGGATLGEGTQVPTTGSGAPVAFDQSGGGSLEGAQAAQMGGGQQGALASMYGPNSTAAGSPMGQSIASTNVEVPGQGNVQFGALGEGTPSAPGAAGATTGATHVGDNGMDMGNYGALMRLFNTGVNAYQQYAKQNAYNKYVNDINTMFAPNSPYAQQMQQTLARQDAAAGRNSQYGTRAVQLAAALTQARAQALGNSNYANARTATPGANALNGLFYNFANPQGMQDAQSLYNMGSSGFNSLQNLFS